MGHLKIVLTFDINFLLPNRFVFLVIINVHMFVFSATKYPTELPFLLLTIAVSDLQDLRRMWLLPDVLTIVVRHDDLLK